jgi:hypothetical protein
MSSARKWTDLQSVQEAQKLPITCFGLYVASRPKMIIMVYQHKGRTV